MGAKSLSFRVGRVRAHRRGRVWYLCYLEAGQRRQPRVGPQREEARRLAAEINGQLEAGAPSALSFQPISIPDLRERWLDYHEHVRRSSVQTIRRYRSATAHLLEFVRVARPVARVSDFHSQHAEEFVRFLRTKKVAPNGHRHARQRPLRDAGISFIAETCCSLFNYAAKHRHLPPYADNPLRVIEVSRMPIEDTRPVIPFTAEQEQTFLTACDDWQFPIFLTLLCTGLRPGELVHLLLPDDLDLAAGWLRIRNKPQLGWQVKTRNERDVPLVPVLRDVLHDLVGQRRTGPVFRQRRCDADHRPLLNDFFVKSLEQELLRRVARQEASTAEALTRAERLQVAQTIWRDLGALKEDWVRIEFKRITKRMGMAEVTAPKTLRHTFATALQDANVDPLIRNQLMGHAPAALCLGGSGLGMTAVYTHTRPETKRRQLEGALNGRPALLYAQQRLRPKNCPDAISETSKSALAGAAAADEPRY
jgi:integrase